MKITAQMVKELREATGAAVLDSKNALEEHEGNFEAAKDYLTEKGLAKVAKKAGREASEGLVHTYTHPGGRVGVMVEVNCETDFVANTEQFKALTHNIALHVAFSNPQYLDRGDVPAEMVEAQQEQFRQQALADGKPEDIADKIVEGRMAKFYQEVCLLPQPFVKDDELTIDELIAKTIVELQENIKIRRFARFELGAASSNEV